MQYQAKRAYALNETTSVKEECYAISHVGAIYTNEDETETLDTKLTSINTSITNATNNVGNLLSLSTTSKSSAVSAINELKASLVETNANLTTTNTNLAKIGNDNLLINGDLKIWQRGTPVTVNSDKWYYTADRFRCKTSSGTVTVSKDSNGLKTSGAIQIQQVLEDDDYNKISGKTVALSYSINNTITTSSFTATSATIFSITLAAGDILNWVKVELGSLATTFIPRITCVELLLCQRYYEIVRLYGRDNGNTGSINMSIPYKVEKRTAPTKKDMGSNIYFNGAWNSVAVSTTADPNTTACEFNYTNTSYTLSDMQIIISAEAEIY